MRKLSFRRVLGLALAIVMAGSLAVSCIFEYETQFDQLEELVKEMSENDTVISVTPTDDGGFVIKFKESGDVKIRKGAPGNSIIKVDSDPDAYIFFCENGWHIRLPRYYETRVLTFEDKDYKGPENTATYWSSLIDEPQYGGPILYGEGSVWVDENNTNMTALVLPYDPTTWSGGLSGGGIAISNYGNGMLAGADYTRQLEVYDPSLDGAGRKGCGHNGSDNFAVVYDAGLWGSNAAAINILEDTPYMIESIHVNLTCYTLNFLVNGDGYNPPMAPDGYYKVTASGFVGNLMTGKSEFILASHDAFVTYWAEWDLSELGAVSKIVFEVSGSDDLYGEYGFNAPAYVAIDDITMRVYPE
jgi:hypothetical protein